MNIYVRNAIVSATGAVILGTGVGCAVQPVARPILQTLTTTTATATTTTVPAIPCIENWGPVRCRSSGRTSWAATWSRRRS